MISLAGYRALLGRAELRQTIAVSALGRLPIGVTGLAILLLVQGATGSFALGGTAGGFYVAGLAAVAPIFGRFIDRYGPRSALVIAAVLFPSALGCLVFAVQRDAAPGLVFALSAAAGCAFPPITVCMRTFLKRRLADEALLMAAYSLEAVLIETIFIVGPLIVALFVAYASPTAAVLFAAFCGCTGSALFVRTPALRSWHIEARTQHSLLGPLTEPGFPVLIAVVLGYSAAFGLLEIGITAYATERATPAWAGVLLGLMSAGSAIGGLAYGSRTWRLPLPRQFAIALALMGAGLACLALPWPLWIFTLLSIASGIVMAPALTMQSMLVAKIARAEHSTEAFTWSSSALLAGVGVGLSAGGAMLDSLPSPAVLLAAGATALAAGAAAWLLLKGTG